MCNKWLTLPASPEILNVDALYEAAHAQKRLDASALAAGRDDRLSSGGGVVLKKTRSYEYAATDSPSGSLDESVSLNQSQVGQYTYFLQCTLYSLWSCSKYLPIVSFKEKNL